jgi:catechol 2,3-dioxygenase-like lactoylglutathione lyase family enzyme
MHLKNCSTALFVKNIAIAKAFYTQTLRQEVELDLGKNIIFRAGFALWEIQTTHIIPQKLGMSNISEENINRFELYFETDNIEEVYEALKAQQTAMVHPIHEEPWGQRTVRFFDPDHHLIEVGESMAQFVRRFYQQGMTEEQVSERTGVPVEEVKRLLKADI